MRRVAVLLFALVVALCAAMPALAGGKKGGGDGRLATHSLRAPVTRRDLLLRDGRPLRERRHRERPRRPARGPPGLRLRPDPQGLLPRRRPQGPAAAHRLHPRPRHDVDLAHAELQEQGRAARGRALRRLPRLLDHRLHADRPAPGHQRRPARARRRGPPAGHEGLLRHHHQPHGRRHRLRGGRPAALRLQGRGAVPDRRRDRSSTTATTPASPLSPRSTRTRPSRTGRCWIPPSRTSRCRPGSTT